MLFSPLHRELNEPAVSTAADQGGKSVFVCGKPPGRGANKSKPEHTKAFRPQPGFLNS